MKKIISCLITSIIILISTILVTATRFYLVVYNNTSLDEILFYIKTGLGGADLSVISQYFKETFALIVLICILAFMPIIFINKIKNNKFRLLKLGYLTVLLAGSIIYSYNKIGLADYIETLSSNSDFIQEEYVDPRNVNITFPENKRNLILIFLESMETTMIGTENSGGWEYTVIPELENLALNNINFSNTDYIGGAKRITGATWTIGGLVGLTSGLPLKLPINGNEYMSENFLAGAISIGDILKDEGYNLEIMFGSDANFGGRYHYFTKHGGYEIFDLTTAIVSGLMKEEDIVFWGFEDKNLFEWAKVEINKLAEKDEPFNFSLLTVNTHFPDGWLEAEAENIYPTQYENVHAYSSKQIYEFVSWIKEQDFYDNTNIILVGDHNSMQEAEYFNSRIVAENFERVTYNAFINSEIKPINEKNRSFTNYDIFPTILASMGVEIEGNKLGLGTNLFSEEKTLVEKYGLEYVDGELKKNSAFYNYAILGEDYNNLINSIKEEN